MSTEVSGVGRPELGLLDPDPVTAERLCEEIRGALVRFFECRNYPDPEDFAHETVLRGLAKLREGSGVYVPIRFFFLGIAKNLAHEQTRVRLHEPIGDLDPATNDTSYQGLNSEELRVLYHQCLGELSAGDREVLLSYVEGDYRELDHTPGSVRIRVHRIRKRLAELLRPGRGRLKLSVTKCPANVIDR